MTERMTERPAEGEQADRGEAAGRDEAADRSERTSERTSAQSAMRGPQQDPQAQMAGASRHSPLALQASRAFGPFGLMRRLFEDLARLSGMGRPREQAPAGAVVFVPEVEIARRGDLLVAQIDLPGLEPDDISVTIENGVLTIEGERRSQHEREEGDVWTCERTYGRFQRVIPLPENAEPGSAEARFENGVLEITLRAPEQETRGRRIEVKSGPAPERQRQGDPP